MEGEKIEMCKSLIEWFKTLNLKAPHSNAEQLSDGVALAQSLNQFSPESFPESWLSKVRSDVGSNWRLKMSNMKKVIEGIYDYYTDVLNYTLSDYPRPDAQKIAEKSDMIELERLLQLILGCAVNCADKQDYITQIMELEESLQQNIMRALQDLESTLQGSSPSRNSIAMVNFDFKLLQEERDALAQKCFEAEKKILLLVEEKTLVQQELTKLQLEMEKHENPSTIGEDGTSLGPMQPGSARYNELRRQMELLKEELLQSETAREDLKIKTQQQEKELTTLQQKIEELTQNTTELSQLKDELDILRESNDKLKVYETQLITYKKKLEDHNDLKKQIKMLEDRSAEYLQQNAAFEEDAKKFATVKGQVELYKKEIQELHKKLDIELSKNDKLEFTNKNLESNLSALQRAKESLLKERDNLREAVDELKCGELSKRKESGNTMSKELQSPALIEKIERLEAENKALREGQGGQTALAQLLDDANKRNDNLREQLKSANEEVLSLKLASTKIDPNAKGGEMDKHLKQLIELNEQKTYQLEDSLQKNTALQAKITKLESTVSAREQELLAFDAKYRKCVEKAKEVIKNLDPRIASVIENIGLEKPQETETESKTGMSTMEEQLMTTAFYRLGVNAQRDAVDTKLAMLMGQGQTFLARQRQSAPRKSQTNTFKSK
ncbi:protein hook [Episyrphus balteatus]|uniref:protein hook n=1 Tax=Episyrphus balteatus TaxID=286459 RepID=UPI0024852707|nr:protein hook [Episyrphus balteatus]